MTGSTQVEANRGAEAHASLYQSHRDRLTAILLENLPPGEASRVALLGAGNCHDVDLEQLAPRCREIHLVDIDPTAVARACQRQPAEVRNKLVPHAPVDLTGLSGHLDGWRAAEPSDSELDDVADRAVADLRERLPGGLDLVVSCCVLTQMHRNVTTTLGLDGALLARKQLVAGLTFRVNAVHLRAMTAALRPGGTALLATDFVSSQSLAIDDLPPPADLRDVMSQLHERGNFFYVVDPAVLQDLLVDEPVLAREVHDLEEPEPWVWQESPRRSYLVYALAWRRR